MEFFYIDEAEGPGTSKFNGLYLLGMVIMNESNLRNVEDELRHLAEEIFGKCDAPHAEFHGHDIYSGKGRFKGMAPADRIAIVERIIALVEAHKLSTGYAVIKKPAYYGNLHPHQLAFLLLVEQIEDRLRFVDSLGVLVADENEKMEQQLVADLELFKTASTSYGWRPTKIEHIADTIHFVRSKNNRLIQLADIICTVILHGLADGHQLLAGFLAEADPERKPPKMQWPEWRAKFASPKQAANIRLWDNLSRHCSVQKHFPR